MESRRKILVGLSISLSGRFSVQERQAIDGLRLWQSYVNGQDGITIGQAAPQPVRLLFYDDRSRASLASQPEILVLAGSFEQEIQIMRARRRWPASIRAVAAVAAGVQPFHDELGRAAEGVI